MVAVVLAKIDKPIDVRERKNFTCDVYETADFKIDWRVTPRLKGNSKLLLVCICNRLSK
jgi:hypothetical protein